MLSVIIMNIDEARYLCCLHNMDRHMHTKFSTDYRHRKLTGKTCINGANV